MAAVFLKTAQNTFLDFEERLGITQNGFLFDASPAIASAFSDTDNTLVTVSGRLWSGDIGLLLSGDDAAVRIFEGGSVRAFGTNGPNGSHAIVFEGANADLINKGIISSVDGVALIFDNVGGVIKNYGQISGNTVAIQAFSGLAAIDNAGLISGEDFSILATGLDARLRIRQFEDGILEGDVFLANAAVKSLLGHVIKGGTTSGEVTVQFDTGGGRDIFDVGLEDGSVSTVFGYTGNDLIRGASIAWGGEGDDSLLGVDSEGTSRGHTAYGEAGRDRITGYIEAYGGDDNDVLIGGSFATESAGGFASGGNGDDTISNFFNMQGGNGNDTIAMLDSFIGGRANGGNGDDLIIGGNNRDFIIGGSGDDQLFGNREIDTFRGNQGDDLIDGGDDSDFVIYAGVQADYSFTLESDGSVTVTDLNTSDGDEGTDTLIDIELVRFDGASSLGAIDIGDLI